MFHNQKVFGLNVGRLCARGFRGFTQFLYRAGYVKTGHDCSIRLARLGKTATIEDGFLPSRLQPYRYPSLRVVFEWEVELFFVTSLTSRTKCLRRTGLLDRRSSC